ncbi:MAG: hypothetical protein B7Y70_13210 [Rhizobiales bacterium 35-68-8]|nr:MAG: hypothetical protein B7Y70_13210 [Rhizobiales bacterium 35-68-8]
MSDFREFAMLSVGTSASDPEALARAVRKHKTGDAMTQAALTVALMLAICAVTFVLSVDRASAMSLVAPDLAQEGSGMLAHTFSALLSLGGVALGAVLISGWMSARRAEAARLVRVPVRARRTR